MHERVVAIAADYADALLVVRRAKRLLLLLLLLTLLGQVALFACVHFGILKPSLQGVRTIATTIPIAGGITAAVPDTTSSARAGEMLHYLTVLTLSSGVVFGILLALTLFLTVHIMLVGRLIGVAYVTRAFVLSLFLALLLFPWQTILATREVRDIVLPGVLYTWGELSGRVPGEATGDFWHQAMYWARFVAWPLVTLIVLLLVQVRSGKGLKLALGEEEVLSVDVGGPDGRTVVR